MTFKQTRISANNTNYKNDENNRVWRQAWDGTWRRSTCTIEWLLELERKRVDDLERAEIKRAESVK